MKDMTGDGAVWGAVVASGLVWAIATGIIGDGVADAADGSGGEVGFVTVGRMESCSRSNMLRGVPALAEIW